MATIADPFAGPPAKEVPLTKAPLERVIAVVHFPLVLTVDRGETVAPFQADLRKRYPVLQEEKAILLTPGSGPQSPPQSVWRFADEEKAWRVSLSRSFCAIETSRYSSRGDFMARFREVLAALGRHITPTRIDRLGLRYVDRIRGGAVEDLAALVRDEMRGVVTSAVSRYCTHSLTESAFEVDGARLLARWGLLPAGSTIDESIPPVDERTWILDLDRVVVGPIAFDVDAVTELVRSSAEQIYKFFRWAVTDKFVERFGGAG
jgi:uncharacterized protein (TIGR04255 family)